MRRAPTSAPPPPPGPRAPRPRSPPTTKFFVSDEEGTYLRAPTPSRLASVAAVFAANAIVLPAPRRADVDPYYVTVQRSRPGAGSTSRMVAVAAWLLLLALGAREAF